MKSLKEVNFLKTITLRVDDELHKKIKLETVKEEITIQNYITELVKKDLKSKE